VEVNFTAGDTGTMQFFGVPAQGRTSKQIAEQLISEHYPDATTDYEIPNALVGYEPGYGVVKDEYPQDASGTFTRLRLLIMVAIKKDYALVAAAIGPYHKFSPDFAPVIRLASTSVARAGYGKVREQLCLARQFVRTAPRLPVLVIRGRRGQPDEFSPDFGSAIRRGEPELALGMAIT
jgi:hypothetical protein